MKKHIRKRKLDDIHILLNTYNLHSFLNKRKKSWWVVGLHGVL